MRKVFCWTAGAAVLLVAGVFTTAQVAIRYPDSLIGRAMFGMSYTASLVNPYVGFAPIVAQLRKKPDSVPQAIAIPEDSILVSKNPVSGGEEASSAPIVIPEDDVVVSTPTEPAEVVELPSGGSDSIAPQMPYCEDSCQPVCTYERISTMPHVEEACEPLPMPGVEEEQEATGQTNPIGAIEGFLRHVEKLLKKQTTPEPQGPECNPHQGCCPRGRSSVCPYSGKSVPCDPPASTPVQEEQPIGDPEKAAGSSQSSRLQNSNWPAWTRSLQNWPTFLRVDTLELRAEDLSLQDFGLPGSL